MAKAVHTPQIGDHTVRLRKDKLQFDVHTSERKDIQMPEMRHGIRYYRIQQPRLPTPLYLGCKFYECEIVPESDDFTAVAGELVENKLKQGVLGIKNCSDRQWKAKMPDGVFYDIAPGKGFPVWQGLEIDFGEVKAQI